MGIHHGTPIGKMFLERNLLTPDVFSLRKAGKMVILFTEKFQDTSDTHRKHVVRLTQESWVSVTENLVRAL